MNIFIRPINDDKAEIYTAIGLERERRLLDDNVLDWLLPADC